jgi:predicted DNA-binding protein with PD1-like motif
VKHKKIGKTYIVSIAKGEEIITSLQKFCASENITLGNASGIGAAEDIELTHYNAKTHAYTRKKLHGSYEIAALMGNITTVNGKPYIHLHITIGDPNFKTYSGHLMSATISGACEIFINTLPGTIERYKDEKETGLNVLKL